MSKSKSKKCKTKITNYGNYEVQSNFKIKEEDIQLPQKVYGLYDKYNQPIENDVHFDKGEKLGSGGQGAAYKVQIEVNAMIDKDLEEFSPKKRHMFREVFCDKRSDYVGLSK